MKQKILLFLLGSLLSLSAMARDFKYTYEGQTLTYTVIDEEAKTCETKEGYYSVDQDVIFAVNVAREAANRIYEVTGRRLSVASVKKVLHNASLNQHIMKFIEGQQSDNPKNNYAMTDQIPCNLLFFGVRDSA